MPTSPRLWSGSGPRGTGEPEARGAGAGPADAGSSRHSPRAGDREGCSCPWQGRPLGDGRAGGGSRRDGRAPPRRARRRLRGGPRGRRGRATAGGGARGQSGKADVFRASFSVVGLVALFSRDFSERGFCSGFQKSKGAQGRLFIGWI